MRRRRIRRLDSSFCTLSLIPHADREYSGERPTGSFEIPFTRLAFSVHYRPQAKHVRRFLRFRACLRLLSRSQSPRSFRFTYRFTIFVSIQRAMAAKTSEGCLSVHPRHGTDMRGLELLRKFLQYSTPIDSTTNSAGRARAGPANSGIPLFSRARRVWPGHLAVVLGADLLS